MVLIGVGLIGGSFALELKRLGLVQQITGIDLNRENLDRALERGVVDRAFEDISAESMDGADLVVVAVPVSALGDICRRIRPFLSATACVTDVGSTKQTALAAFGTHLPEHLPYCIAAHPIAGSDRSGAVAAQFGLYRGKKLVVTPHGEEHPDALAKIEALWRAVGAEVVRMSAKEHDAVFAAVSHMPHLAAFSYVHQIYDHPDGQRYLDFAASGFRDFTRIASSHPAIWTDICLANKDSLLDLIAGMQHQLSVLEGILAEGDRTALYRYFDEAKRTRDGWLEGQ